MKVVLLLLFILMHSSLSQRSSPQEADIFGDPDCTCYRKINSFSCRCEGGVRISADGDSSMNLRLVCGDANQVAFDPYRHLSLMDLEHVVILKLQIAGCPPPERSYSALPVREGTQTKEIGHVVPIVELTLSCGNLDAFQLQSQHFSEFESVSVLSIQCPSLSNLTQDLLLGISDTSSNIRITDTALDSIPSGVFSRFKRLRYLSLKGNKLKTFGYMRGLQNLNHLNIKDNEVERIREDGLEHLKNVRFIDVSGNLISRLPKSLCGLRSLRGLKAQNNRIEFVEEGCFESLASLKLLRMEGNRLRTLESLTSLGKAVGFSDYMSEPNKTRTSSSSLSNSTELSRPTRDIEDEEMYPFRNPIFYFRDHFSVVLNFSRNDISSVHESAFFNYVNLTELDLSFNGIHSLPAKLFHGKTLLRTLVVSNNVLTNISETLLSDNADLEYLDLSCNGIRTLGEEFFSGTPDLRDVNLSNNDMDTLPGGIFLPLRGSRDSEAPLVLNLEGNRLATLPNLNINRLAELNLARNRLSHIQHDALSEALSLRRINLSFNSINSTEISLQNHTRDTPKLTLFHAGLRRLSSIDLSHNLLSAFPTVKHVEESLVSLNLSGNRIRSIFPQSLDSKATSLERLDLSNNSLSALFNENVNSSGIISSDVDTSDLRELKRLKYLDLSRNGITHGGCLDRHSLKRFVGCDSFLVHLLRLEVLILAHNEIEVIPVHFESLPKLRFVDMTFNKVKKVSHEHLFFLGGLRKDMLVELGDSEGNYVRRGPGYFELPNCHNLTVDLRHNEIEYLDLPDEKTQIVAKSFHTEKHFSRGTILLGSNPFICNCQVFKLLRYAEQQIRPVSEEEMWKGLTFVLPVKIDIQDLSCWEPVSVRGKCLSDPETWTHHLLPLLGLCGHLE